jgi:hypothetical protein
MNEKALSLENLLEAISLNNTKLIEYFNTELESLRKENATLRKEVQTLSETLNSIINTNAE